MTPTPSDRAIVAEHVSREAGMRLKLWFIDPPAPPSMREITAEVAAKHGLTVEQLKSPSCVRIIARARQEAMWRIRQETNKSLPNIGQFFGGRDHTTVLFGVRAHAARLEASLSHARAEQGAA